MGEESDSKPFYHSKVYAANVMVLLALPWLRKHTPELAQHLKENPESALAALALLNMILRHFTRKPIYLKKREAP